jgi:uncharacterized damage-inducible protein DinB
MTHLTKLIRHCIWANEAWMDFISESCPSDECLMKRMSHILLGEQIWFQRLLGEQLDRDILRIVAIPELRNMLARHRASYDGFLAGNLERVVAFKRLTGEEYQLPVSDILLHLTLHGAHRRGQMATYASGKGLKPANTDYVQYCLLNGL